MDAILEQINSAGKTFVEFAVPMLVQSSVLIAILLLADFVLRKKVRAVFRYCVWMLVLVKLVLPATLSAPVSLGYLFGDRLANIEVSDTAAVVNSASVSQAMEPVPVGVSSKVPEATPTGGGTEPLTIEAAGPAAVAATPITWQGVVFLVWLAVVIAMGLLLVQRVIFVMGLVKQAKKANGLMNDALKYCRKCVGVKGEIGLKVSANATSPAVCGLFRPVILVPENLGPSLGAGHLRTVLMHELAHIKRGDLWVNLAQTVLQIIYFYNPLLWLANAIIRRAREQAVDETVQVVMGERANQYPEMLVDVAKLAFERPALSLRLIGVVESKSLLTERVKHMLNRPIPKSAKLGILGLIAVLVFGAVLLPMAKAEKQPVSRLIVPGQRVGDFTFDMSKDDLLKSLGKPERIFYGEERYTLANLPRRYYLHFGDVSFLIVDDSVKEITAVSPFYKFTNGLGVGDSEQQIIQAFGDDFYLKETEGKDFLTYKDKGLVFEIFKHKRTVMEISVLKTLDSKMQQSVNRLILPGLRVGNYTLGMSKDDVLKSLGKTKEDSLREAGNSISVDGLILNIIDDTVKSIDVLSPLYKFADGLGIGSTEQQVIEAFGEDFHLKQTKGKDFLSYKDKGLVFEIFKHKRTVMEITVLKNADSLNGLGFLAAIPEFRDLHLGINEHQLQQHTARYSIATNYHKTKDETTYHLYTEEGENIIVMFHNGRCSGIQRMRPDRLTAIKLFTEKYPSEHKQKPAGQVEGETIAEQLLPEPEEITVDKLAEICKRMESAFHDITVEYEWYDEPPLEVDDIAGKETVMAKGRPRHQLQTARPFYKRIRFIEIANFQNTNGTTWSRVEKTSYNGKILKHLSKSAATISEGRLPDLDLYLTPLGFSIFALGSDLTEVRFDMAPPWDILRSKDKERVHLYNRIKKINGFETIRADLLHPNKQIYLRIYFSVEHGYTPVKFEYIRNGSEVASTVEVTSLQKIADGLWFPSSGIMNHYHGKTKIIYKAIGNIVINQGLKEEDFDIEFPTGTEVDDQVRGIKYIITSTEVKNQETDVQVGVGGKEIVKIKETTMVESKAPRDAGRRIIRQMDIKTRKKEIAAKLAVLTEHQNHVQRELRLAERALDDVRRASGFTDLEKHNYQHIVTKRLNDLELALSQLVLARKQLQANIGIFKKQAADPIDERIERQIERDPVMVILIEQLVLRELELAEKRIKFDGDHEEVRQAQEMVGVVRRKKASRREEIANRIRQSNLKDTQDQLFVLEDRLKELEKMRAEAAARKRELDLARVQYEQRAAIRDERRRRLDELRTQIEKLRIMHDAPEARD